MGTEITDINIKEVLGHYPRGLASTGQIGSGYVNEGLIVEDVKGERYYLKKYGFWFKDESVESFVRAMGEFSKAGAPVHLPINNIEGKPITTVGGDRYMLSKMHSGESVTREDVSLERIYGLAKFQAQMHLALKDINEGYGEYANFPKRRKRAMELISSKLPNIEGLMLREFLKRRLEFLKNSDVPSIKGAPQLVHADLTLNNVFFEGDYVNGLIDFDNVKLADPYALIARNIATECFHIGYNERGWGRVKSYLRGYMSVTPIDVTRFSNVMDIARYYELSGSWLIEMLLKEDTDDSNFKDMKDSLPNILQQLDHYIDAYDLFKSRLIGIIKEL